MTISRHLLLALMLAAALLLALAAAPSSSAPLRTPTAQANACGTVSYAGRTYIMYRNNVGCRFAKRAIRRLHSTRRAPRGWRCGSGTRYRTGGGCVDGRRNFGWHPVD